MSRLPIYIDYWYEGRSIDECELIVRILNDRTELEKYRTMIYHDAEADELDDLEERMPIVDER